MRVTLLAADSIADAVLPRFTMMLLLLTLATPLPSYYAIELAVCLLLLRYRYRSRTLLATRLYYAAYAVSICCLLTLSGRYFAMRLMPRYAALLICAFMLIEGGSRLLLR